MRKKNLTVNIDETFIGAYDKSKDFVSRELVLKLIKCGFPVKSIDAKSTLNDFTVDENYTFTEKVSPRKHIKYYIPTISQVSRWFASKGFKVETGPYWIKKKIHWQFMITKNYNTSKQVKEYSPEDGMLKTNQDAILCGFEYIIDNCIK